MGYKDQFGRKLAVAGRSADAPSYLNTTDGTVSSGTVAATTTSIFSLFNPVGAEEGSSRRARINRLLIMGSGGVGGDPIQVKVARISADTTGGTPVTGGPKASDNVATQLSVKRAAASSGGRGATVFMGMTSAGASNDAYIDMPTMMDGEPLTLKRGEGIEVFMITGAAGPTTARLFSAAAEWSEDTD